MLKRIKTTDLCDLYIQNKRLKGLKESSLANYYTKIEKYVLPIFPTYIYKVKENDLSEELVKIIPQLSKNTYNNMVVVINAVLKFAYDKHYLKRFIRFPTLKLDVNKIVVFSDEEQEILTKYLCDNMNNFNFGVFLTLNIGLRVGELSALEERNINSEYVEVENTLQRVKLISPTPTKKTLIVIDKPKSKKSERKIPLVEPVQNYYKKISKSQKDNYLLTDSLKFIEPRTIQRKLKKILMECNIEDRKFHALRDTFATNCVRRGMDIKTLSELLGHSDTSMTLKYYVFVDFEYKKEAMKKLSK